jgi:hypothetical protein
MSGRSSMTKPKSCRAKVTASTVFLSTEAAFVHINVSVFRLISFECQFL